MEDKHRSNKYPILNRSISFGRPMAFFIILYLVATFGFGFIYTSYFPDDFIATSIKSEPTWKTEMSLAEDKITNRIEAPLQRASGDLPEQRTPLTADELKELLTTPLYERPKLHMMPIGDLTLKEFHLEDGDSGPVLKMNVTFEVESNNGGYWYEGRLTGRYYPASSSEAKDIERNATYGIYGGGVIVIQRDGSPWSIEDPIFSSLVPRRTGEHRGVVLNQMETDVIEKLISKYRGIHNVGSDWKRMAYFSSVVITTLGLGDIVPLSNGARTAVALEAAIGIVLFGLFVSVISGIFSRPVILGEKEYDAIHDVIKKEIAESEQRNPSSRDPGDRVEPST